MTTNTNFDIDMNVETAVDKVEDAAGKAQEKVNETATIAKEQAKRAAAQVSEQAKATVDSRMTEVASELGSVATAVRQTSYDVAGESETVARYGEKIAEQLEGISSYLNEKGVEDVLTDLQDFARRQPAVFLGGAFMLGMVVGRFVRSSGDRFQAFESNEHGRYDNAGQGSGTGYNTYYGSDRYTTGLNQESTTSQN